MHYQNPEDLKLAQKLAALAPGEAQAFVRFKSSAERADGIIPLKYRELISLAVALAKQCAYCIDVHSKGAVRSGASPEELAETVLVAAAVNAGAIVGHGLLALRLASEEGNQG